MSLDLRSTVNAGSLGGLHTKIAELQRRLARLEVSGSSIGSGAITSSHIGQHAVNGYQVAPESIVTGHLTAGIITTSYIAANAITANLIDAGAINAGHIQADAITTEHIEAGSIITEHIVAGAIQSGLIAAGAITTTKIDAEAVTTEKLAAGAVTAEKITVADLSSLTADLGLISAGTITGATFQTNTSGSRVVMDSLGLRGYAIDGITKVFEINAGSGVASFTGIANLDPLSSVPGATVDPNSLPADRIVAGSITAAQIAAGAITTNTIAAGAVTASKLTLDWGGSNLLFDSSFEGTLYDPQRWSVTRGGTWIPTTRPTNEVLPIYGERVLRVDGAATAGDLRIAAVNVVGDTPGFYPVLSAQQYTMSAYVASPRDTRDTRAEIYWYDALGRQGLLPPTSTPADVTSGGTLPAASEYQYRVTALNAQGESDPLQVNAFSVPNGSQITFTVTAPEDASGTPYPVTAIRVYRRTASSGPFDVIELPSTGSQVHVIADDGTLSYDLAAATPPNPGEGEAWTVANRVTLGTYIATELPTISNSAAPYTTSTTVVTGPHVLTGAPAGALWARWVRPTVTGTVPEGAAYAEPVIRIARPSGIAGERHYVDGAQFERGDIATGYASRSGEVLPGTIGPTQITPNSITTEQIKANSILAGDLDVSQLSAITANLGSITAGNITGVTITGALVRTAVSGPRTEMSSGGLVSYGSAGQIIFQASGGTVSMVGSISSGFFGSLRGTLGATDLTGYGANNLPQMRLWYSGALDFSNDASARVRYTHATSGRLAELSMTDGPQVPAGAGNINANAYTGTVHPSSLASLTAINGTSADDVNQNYAVVQAQYGDGLYRATARANGKAVTIINSLDQSSFFRHASANSVDNFRIGHCVVDYWIGGTGEYTWNQATSGYAYFPTLLIREVLVENHSPLTPNIQVRAWPIGSGTQVGMWFWNGTGASQAAQARLVVLAW